MKERRKGRKKGRRRGVTKGMNEKERELPAYAKRRTDGSRRIAHYRLTLDSARSRARHFHPDLPNFQTCFGARFARSSLLH